MQQTAQRKGVCYHTVSRAVRAGRLPGQRLGRQVFITAVDLEAWQPQREHAPRKYRHTDPDPDVTASVLSPDALDRVTLEATLTALATALIYASGSLTVEQLQEVNEYLSGIVL
jgi:Helix-turn-helix domain